VRVASLTSRGKAVAGLALLASTVLCVGAATALVKATEDDSGDGVAAPRPQPTLSFGTSPTPQATSKSTPTPAASPAPVASVSATASPRASATATSSSSPRPRTTSSPRTLNPVGLGMSAQLDPAAGDIFTDDLITLTVHATDGDGEISLGSVNWGDGHADSSPDKEVACSAPGKADCENYTIYHRYTAAGTFAITLTVRSGGESQVLHFTIEINPRGDASPSPTPTPSPTSSP